MSEQAINSIEKLHDSPAQDLVAYLDFLLKTELATSINASDPFFGVVFQTFQRWTTGDTLSSPRMRTLA